MRLAVLKRSGALAMALFCLGVLIWALIRANAAWHFFVADQVAKPLFETGVGSEEVFDESELHINQALKRFPNNPDFLDFYGRLQLLKASQPGVMGSERRQLLELAAANFRRALLARPLWPYSWVNLLAAKDKLGQADAEFNRALKKSADLGPWEPRVQLQVIQSGLRFWGRLGSIERAVVQKKVLDAFKVQPRSTFELVKDYGRSDMICQLDEVPAQVGIWCEKVTGQAGS